MTQFLEGAEPTRRISGGERFRLVLEHSGVSNIVGVVARSEVMQDAWARIGNSKAAYAISPRPPSNVKVATIDVRVRMDAAGLTVADMVDRIQTALGVWSRVFSVRALDAASLSPAVAPAEREAATREAATAGAGRTGIEKGFASVFGQARKLVTLVAVGAGVALVAFFFMQARKVS